MNLKLEVHTYKSSTFNAMYRRRINYAAHSTKSRGFSRKLPFSSMQLAFLTILVLSLHSKSMWCVLVCQFVISLELLCYDFIPINYACDVKFGLIYWTMFGLENMKRNSNKSNLAQQQTVIVNIASVDWIHAIECPFIRHQNMPSLDFRERIV